MATEKLNKKQKKLKSRKDEQQRRKGLEPEKIVEEKVKAAADKKAQKQAKQEKQQKSKRNILFIGNLGYNTSEETLKEHFKSCTPTFRMRKGFAFAEFDGVDATKRLNVALRLHHTILEGRKINVELTAGGGGNSKARHQKLRERNDKLNEERETRIKKEQQESIEKAKRESAKSKDGNKPAKSKTEEGPAIHPSRLKMMG